MDHKLVASLDDVILTCGLRDGMTVDFNHCLRNGDYVVASVMHAIAKAGLRDIRIFASAIMDGMMEQGLTDLIRQGVISSVEVTGNSGILGRMISHGEFSRFVVSIPTADALALLWMVTYISTFPSLPPPLQIPWETAMALRGPMLMAPWAFP